MMRPAVGCYSHGLGCKRISVVLLAMMSMVSPASWPHMAQAQSTIRLDDVTDSSGIDFIHFSGGTDRHYIIETVTSGLATFDFDDDGWIDIYLLSGSSLPQAVVRPGQRTARPSCKLYRNLGGCRFADVSTASGTAETGFALGVAAGDYDNDGDQDLFVSNYGPDVLLCNNGDGTFTRRQFDDGQSQPHVGAGVSLLDADSDGTLDVYFARYIRFSFDQGVSRTIFGVPAAPGPKDYDPDKHVLLAGDGCGGFRDVTQSAGIGRQPGPGMGSVAFDFDRDGDTDIFVCNDSAANFLFENKGNGQFEEIAVLAGVAYDVTGAQQASMGTDTADFNGDGWLDLVTTSFVDELPTLCRNSGQGYFDDIAAAAGLGSASRSVTWGVGFSDLDNDGWSDLFIASGHLIAGSSLINDTERFAAPNLVYRNQQGRRFANVSSQVGTASRAVQVSRGVAIDDLDNDGRNDIVVLNLNDRPQIIRNVSAPAAYIQCELVGSLSNRDAIGSRVSVQVDGRTIVQEVIAGRGYQSHFGSRLHFGLGPATRIDHVDVQWHAGQTQRFEGIDINRRWLLRQGDAQAVELP